MALTRQKIVDTALEILRSYGLADLSMRRLARDLGVQPGALYWHVKNKQELLVVLAERILEPVKVGDAGGDPDSAVRRSAQDLRAALLAVRDGSDVVSLAQALAPESLTPLSGLAALLTESGLSELHAHWGAKSLTHYILGAVAEEQTRAELARSGLLEPGPDSDTDGEAFLFGVNTLLEGLQLHRRR
ncbi:MAG: TetR/AcrR family transcriptional regulator C-terminal domain-containing protein [Actinomycetota bacterium]